VAYKIHRTGFSRGASPCCPASDRVSAYGTEPVSTIPGDVYAPTLRLADGERRRLVLRPDDLRPAVLVLTRPAPPSSARVPLRWVRLDRPAFGSTAPFSSEGEAVLAFG
jgi:hypothetical protein